MQNENYQNIIGFKGERPTFHDAELVGIEHRRTDRELLLRFTRVDGTTGTFRFMGVVSQRVVDFAEQNVVSRLLISPTYNFSSADVAQWSRWVDSREDFQATVDQEHIDRHMADFAAGRKALFVLEPSCGAEVAVVCDSIWLSLATDT
jgi:pyruvate-formate lyase-activating enzyme